jgi:hypothetical protein
MQILKLRAELLELGSTVRQLRQAGRGCAAPVVAQACRVGRRDVPEEECRPNTLQWYDESVTDPWLKSLNETRRLATRQGWCYQHV